MGRSFANQAPNKESHLIHLTQELPGSALNDLAGLYKDQDDLGRALPLSRRAVAIARTLSPNYGDTFGALSSRGPCRETFIGKNVSLETRIVSPSDLILQH
jgi:hypothetical protein